MKEAKKHYESYVQLNCQLQFLLSLINYKLIFFNVLATLEHGIFSCSYSRHIGLGIILF